MKRILYGLLPLSLLFSGCDDTRFREALHVDLEDAVIYPRDDSYDPLTASGLLVYTERKSDGYWNISVEIPGLDGLLLGPEHTYSKDRTHYLFKHNGEYIELRCGDYPSGNTLTSMREGAARASARMNLRNAQSEMRQVRMNAQVEGINITASPWETASVPLGYE